MRPSESLTPRAWQSLDLIKTEPREGASAQSLWSKAMTFDHSPLRHILSDPALLTMNVKTRSFLFGSIGSSEAPSMTVHDEHAGIVLSSRVIFHLGP